MADALAGQACAFEFCTPADESATAHQRHFTSCFIPCPDALGNIDRLIGISGEDDGQQELPL
jgi:hypothetical protein